MTLPTKMEEEVIARVKVLSNMDVTERRHPQDGHCSIDIGEKTYDMRAATLPTVLGEKMVLRMLNADEVFLGLRELGLEPEQLKIVEAAERNHLPVQVGHQKRYGLAYTRARAYVQNQEAFGNIIQIEAKMHGFPVFPTFYTCMLEWQCHNLDLIQSFGGTITEIEAKAHKISPTTGALTIMLRFESGALGILGWGTYGGPGQFAERIEILSDKGRGVIIKNAREVTFYQEEVGQTWTNDWNPISSNQSHVFNGYVGELRHFVDCVRDSRPPVPSIQDELRTMKYLTEIARKAEIPLEWAFISSAL